MVLVGGEVLERTPIRPGVESHDGEAVFGQTTGEGATARARAHDRKVHRLVERVLAHRDPTARPENIRGAAAGRSKGAGSVGRPIPVGLERSIRVWDSRSAAARESQILFVCL